jgi:hypothetical protein
MYNLIAIQSFAKSNYVSKTKQKLDHGPDSSAASIDLTTVVAQHHAQHANLTAIVAQHHDERVADLADVTMSM